MYKITLIHGYDYNYYIDTLGNVYKDGRQMHGVDNGTGYKQIKLLKNGKRIAKYIHRLVWENFCEPVEIVYEINHIDHNRSNNALQNLEIVTHQENMDKAVAHGSMRRLWTKDKIEEASKCPICGEHKHYRASKCMRCANTETGQKLKNRAMRPTKEELSKYIYSDLSIVAISKIFNVSDNAIRKWCKFYELPYRLSDRKY